MDISGRIGKVLNTVAYAKINLTLEVTGRLTSGLHLLRSVICPIDLTDDLSVEITPEPGVKISCSYSDALNEHFRVSAYSYPEMFELVRSLDSPSNLAARAARAFLEDAGISERLGAAIRLHKRIPIQAGLGGGSADAAAVLRAMGSLFELPLTGSLLNDIAARLGSDVPSQLTNQAVFIYGTGRNVAPLRICGPALRAWHDLAMVVVKPLVCVNTALAYQGLGYQPTENDLLDVNNRLIDRQAVSKILEQYRGVLLKMGLDLAECEPSHQNHNKKLTLLEQEGSHAMPVEGFQTTSLFNSFVNDFERSLLDSGSDFGEVFELLRSCGAGRVLLAGSGSAVIGFSSSFAEAERIASRVRQQQAPGWFVQAARLHLAPGCMMQRQR